MLKKLNFLLDKALSIYQEQVKILSLRLVFIKFCPNFHKSIFLLKPIYF